MNEVRRTDRSHARWARLSRVLAFLPAAGASTLSFCGGPGNCPTDQRLAATARYDDGGVIPPAVAAQCAAPGPQGAPCNAPITCVSTTEFCCGQWTCQPASSVYAPDAGGDAAFRWDLRICIGGPLRPPELDA